MKRALTRAIDASLGVGRSGIPTKRPARQKEGKLSDAIRAALAYEPGLLLLRNSRVAVVKGNRMVRGGLGDNGAADLIGVLTVTACDCDAPEKLGRGIALEVKRPGEIPDAERVGRILDKVAMYRADRCWETIGPAAFLRTWSAALMGLSKDDRYILEQEAFLDSWRKAGGFAAYVDSVDSARAAIARARGGQSA